MLYWKIAFEDTVSSVDSISISFSRSNGSSMAVAKHGEALLLYIVGVQRDEREGEVDYRGLLE